ncbi:hypothetical protein Rhopal_001919-T1 [Rhodotorula paludigena]|uniref:Uncharacterized protein n=1 Tax=Rhodotorula paludigena TaxID=86838 RepID=A0AAV5GFQ7_9BASI|nr:hypothetical protein Rhopal_001919-T1 [Rhodotorula paludigena]
MTALEHAYRPRAPTRQELQAEAERAREGRQRRAERDQREHERLETRKHRLHYSAHAGIAYKDYTLGRLAPVKSRAALDAEAYAARDPPRESGTLDAVPRLADCCLAVLVDRWGEPGLLDALDPVRGCGYAAKLLDRLEHATGLDHLPFQTWLDVSYRYVAGVPSKRRTYRGLCVSDRGELAVLKEVNEEAVHRFMQESAFGSMSSSSSRFAPAFFLAFLDLSGTASFSDDDIYKLRDPLSHFLAVLRLDGTGVTDGGLVWIARAAKDRPQYAHLQVLSLRGLRGVTNEGVGKLSHINLRLIDVRQTMCSTALRGHLNQSLLTSAPSSNAPSSSSRTHFWRHPRPDRSDLAPSLSLALEAQLFDPSNFSPSRMLSTLHYLAQIESAPPGASKRAIAAQRALSKPLGVHLTSLTRAAAVDPTRTAPKPDRTAEELYTAQLALSYGAKHAAHHAAFGAVTSTVALSRKAIQEEGRRETDKGAAFRARDDGVAAGQWVGPGEPGGAAGAGAKRRTTLWDAGTRKLSGAGAKTVQSEREPFSDSEGEADKDALQAAREADELRAWEEQSAAGSFYRRERPVARGPRAFVDPPVSELMLIRHPPCVPPWEERAAPPVAVQAEQASAQAVGGGAGSLLKKRKRPSFDGAAPQRPAARPSPASDRPAPPSLSSSPAAPAPQPRSSHTLYTARSAPKNIVKTAPTLPKRSALSAFRTKK